MLADHQIMGLSEIVEPFIEQNVQPASLDCTLHNEFLRVNDTVTPYRIRVATVTVDVSRDPPVGLWRSIKSDALELEPNEFVLACTVEKFSLPNDIIARVEGRSSLGRLGLMVHVTAGFIDPGFRGRVTLELKNIAPYRIRIHAGMRICQMAFTRLWASVKHPY